VGTEFGLYRVNLSQPKIELISGTEKLHVRSIYISPSSPGQVFFTTYEHGIFLYAGSGLIQFPLDYNRYLAAAHCIVEDKKGFFWIPTNRGLFEVAKGDLLSYAALPEKERINAKGPFYLYYSKENGFNSNEFNGGCQPCMLRLPSGKVSLPSMNGLVWFVPENITPELPAAGIFIDKVEASGQELAVVHDAVVFPAAPKNIRIGFSSPFFGHAQNLHLSYALVEGENSPGRGDWQEVDNQNLIVSFSSLSSGRHTLFIRKSGGFGPGNITLKKIRLTVLPLWYETIWARFAFILVAGAAIFFYTRLRTAYLQRKNIELEEKVNSRTEELEEVLASLQHSETELYKQLHIRTRLVASISHDINSPMRYMEIAARDLEKMIAEKNYIKAAATSREVALALSNTRRLLENMLTYIKTQVEGQDIKFDQVLVKSIIQEKMELFSQMAKRQDNKFVAKMDAGLAVYTSRQLYSIIIHNLIDNANKYTFEGTIQIYTDADERGTHLIIADTGPGLPTYLLEWLNSPHTLETMERAMLYADRQHGLGLIIVKEIAAMLSMEIFAENVNGTRIHVISKGECGV
jgi:signal transduction histidine kinase